MPDVPALLRQSVAQQIAAFQQREFALAGDIRRYYQQVIGDFREELQQYFLRHFYTSLNAANEPVWDTSAAKQLDTMTSLAADFFEDVDAAETDLSEQVQDELEAEYEDGYAYALWLLYQGGVEIPPDTVLPDTFSIRTALLAASIAGLAFRPRYTIWTSSAKVKFVQQLRASILSGQTLPETLRGYDALGTALATQAESLAVNELFRSGVLGTAAAMAAFRDELDGEVWLTREDILVCLFCRAKHLTITTDQPIIDSHPNCRCRKVPLPLHYRARPVEYVAFLEHLHQPV